MSATDIFLPRWGNRKTRLLNRVGDGGSSPTPRLHRRDWWVATLPAHSDAVALIQSLHYAQGAPNTSTFRHALYRRDSWPLLDGPYGVALWIPPTRGAAETVDPEWRGVLALSRFVLDPTVPVNGASFLLAHSMRALDRKRWPTLLTYADTAQGHTGTIYKATGWECLGPVAAGDVWKDESGVQRGRKRGGRTLLAAEMRALGFTRQPQLPKIKFVHRMES